MNILRAEFQNDPPDSFNGLVGEIVRKLRFGRSNLQIDEFKEEIVKLKKIEATLQKIERDLGESPRSYISEIMDELDKKGNLEAELFEELEWCLNTIIIDRFEKEYSLDEFLYSYRDEKAVQWLEFFGYNAEKEADLKLLLAKKIFESICKKFGVIFLDLS